MKRIAYSETEVATDDHLADLVLQYATLLARSGGADTVVFPGIVHGGFVESVSMLIGPASQLTAWQDGEPFPGDVTDAVAELDRRIGLLSAGIAPEDAEDGSFDDFDEPGGPRPS